MIEKLKQRMNIEIAKLPKNNQEAINFVDWIKITEEIGKNFLLTEEQINDLLLETGFIIIGIYSLDLYTLNIEEKIQLSTNTANKITEEVADKVLIPIVNKMELEVKNNLKHKNPSWNQNVNFIVSGGDYSIFLEKTKSINNTIVPEKNIISNIKIRHE